MEKKKTHDFVTGRFAEKSLFRTETGIKRFLEQDEKAWPYLAAVSWAGYLLKGLGCVEITSIQLEQDSDIVSCAIGTRYMSAETMWTARKISAPYNPETTVLFVAFEIVGLRQEHCIHPFHTPEGKPNPPAAFATMTPANQARLIGELQGRF
jgi:hypothetical protein